MARISYRENIQQQMQSVVSELSKLQSSNHILSGQKVWKVFDQKREYLEKELKDTLEEYQRILRFSFDTKARATS